MERRSVRIRLPSAWPRLIMCSRRDDGAGPGCLCLLSIAFYNMCSLAFYFYSLISCGLARPPVRVSNIIHVTMGDNLKVTSINLARLDQSKSRC